VKALAQRPQPPPQAERLLGKLPARSVLCCLLWGLALASEVAPEVPAIEARHFEASLCSGENSAVGTVSELRRCRGYGPNLLRPFSSSFPRKNCTCLPRDDFSPCLHSGTSLHCDALCSWLQWTFAHSITLFFGTRTRELAVVSYVNLIPAFLVWYERPTFPVEMRPPSGAATGYFAESSRQPSSRSKSWCSTDKTRGN
jgi:hypothetical protein